MPDVTSIQVSVNKDSQLSLSNGMVQKRKQVTVTLPDNGTDADDKRIMASAFGLSSIEDCSPFISTENDEIIPAAVAENKLYILLSAAATDAPTTYSGTYNFVVLGYA